MHKQRLAVIVAAGLGVISTFLPWFGGGSVDMGMFGSVAMPSFNGIQVWQGILTLLLCAAAGAFAFLGNDRNGPIDAGNVKIVAGAGGAAFVLVLLVLLGNFSYAGFGLYIALLATLGIVAVPFVIKDSGEFEMPTKESIKDEFNEIKDN